MAEKYRSDFTAPKRPRDEQDPFRMLGVSRTATATELKSAYREQAKRWHPDQNGPETEEDFKALSNAFKTLSKELGQAARVRNRERKGSWKDVLMSLRGEHDAVKDSTGNLEPLTLPEDEQERAFQEILLHFVELREIMWVFKVERTDNTADLEAFKKVLRADEERVKASLARYYARLGAVRATEMYNDFASMAGAATSHGRLFVREVQDLLERTILTANRAAS